jgi:hypothetical protein
MFSKSDPSGYIMACQPGITEYPMECTARKNPMKAKGMAKMVCENFTRLK